MDKPAVYASQTTQVLNHRTRRNQKRGWPGRDPSQEPRFGVHARAASFCIQRLNRHSNIQAVPFRLLLPPSIAFLPRTFPAINNGLVALYGVFACRDTARNVSSLSRRRRLRRILGVGVKVVLSHDGLEHFRNCYRISVSYWIKRKVHT